MNITSSADILFTLSAGQHLGQLRRSMWSVAQKLIAEMTRSASDMVEVVQRDGLSSTLGKRRAAWKGVLNVTSKIAAAYESLAQLQASEVRASAMKGEVAALAGQLIELAEADIPDAILPPDLRAQLQATLNGQSDPEKFAISLLGLTRPSNGAEIAASLNWFNGLRLRALNANLLSEIEGADPDSAAATDDDLDTLGRAAKDRWAAVRDAALTAGKRMRTADASPTRAATLWGAIYRFEDWLVDAGTAALAKAAAAATARVDSGDQAAERWAREVGKAYDLVRQGLAFDAGLRAVLLSYSLRDTRQLGAFAEASRLPVASATLDLPRSSLAELGARAEGEVVEIAAVVSDAEFRVGGPSNRSVLTLGPSRAARVLVPHVAVDSFGISKGAWIQVRGKVFPNGKDGIAGPVVMAGRIARSEAARDSFTDALIFAGRDYFDLRPGDLDIVASRIAGVRATLNEIGMHE